MVYVDTSAFVPVFVREAGSESVIRWITASGEHLAVSEWTLVEFASAMSIKVRSGQIGAALSKRVTARASQFVHSHCTMTVPQRDEFRRAAELAADHGLGVRAGDALHLAVAESLNVSAVLCLDRGMVDSARALGIETVMLAG